MSKTTIDWKAAEAVASRLCLHTRNLVADRDSGAVPECALRAAREHDVGSHSVPRVSSYFELGVLVGHNEPETETSTEPKKEVAGDAT
jgi:hypothetical protein